MWRGSASNMSTPSHIQREVLHFSKTKVSRRQFVSRALRGNSSNSLCDSTCSMCANVASEHRTQLRRAWCQRTYDRALVVKSIELNVGDLNTIMTKDLARATPSKPKSQPSTRGSRPGPRPRTEMTKDWQYLIVSYVLFWACDKALVVKNLLS